MNTNKINVTKRRNSSLIKIAAVMALAISAQVMTNLAHAGAGWGDNIDVTGQPIKVPTYYANSPTGLRPNVDPNAAVDPVTGLVPPIDSGTAIRKFVDTLPSILSPNLAPSTSVNTCGALTTGNCNGQYLPLAAAEKWVDSNGNVTNDDYYEIGIVEYTERMHTDLFKATRVRGYVQLSTVKTPGKQIPLFYPDGTPVYKWKKDSITGIWAQSAEQVTAVDTPHYLGPVILAVSGVPVRIKFTNYLPFGTMKGAESFIPVDRTIPGAGETYGGIDGTVTLPDGTTAAGVVHEMLQNRTAIHWHGGDSPWISDGTPHQWFAPAGEVDYYANGLGKGPSAQNVPDMPDPGPGSMTMFFPNEMSGRLMWYHEHVSGLTRLNAYAGVAAGYLLIDPTEWGLAGAGVLPGEQIPLVIQDKTFVPKDIAQQDARWSTTHWGSEGDLWFPHVYETNQDPNSFDGTNPVGRWDWGPWFWPIFPAQYSLPSGEWGDVSTTPEAFMDTAVVNGTAYPTVTVDPKAYRFRILNGANDRFWNLSFFQAIDSTGKLCDLNAPIGSVTHTNSPIAEASGVACTEVKMVPAVPTATFPPTWPTDGRFGGVPDPDTAGPDIIHIGTEGGLMPHPALIPAHPIAYEMNRRSITVLNILDRALLLGGAERADIIVDFSQFAGKTLILFNDAPAPVPANDPRIDYFSGMEDFSGSGGSFGTLPGYGPNTRTLMQVVVRNTPPAPAFLPKAPGYMSMDAAAVDPGITPEDAQKFAAFDVAMAAVYGATQSRPIVPQPEYNQAFGTTDAQNLARIYTGSISAPTFDFTPTGVKQPVRSVGLVGGGTGYRAAPIVEIVGGGIDLSPAGIAAGNRAAVIVAEVDNIATPYIPPNTVLGTPAVPAHIPTYKLTGLRLIDPGFGYISAPQVLFKPVNGGVGAVASVQLQSTISLQIKSKAIHELFEPVYGRMNAILAMELPFTSALIQTTIPLNYVDPVTEILGENEIQIWKITHNGVDSHPVHFHLVNVQVLNRIGWDGTVKPIQPYEFGWKETVLMNPLEDIVVAVKARRPVVPFGQPKSQRLMDPTQPVGSLQGFSQVDPFTNLPLVVSNAVKNYDNEYVWHCHILGHEENDFMRPVVFNPIVTVPDAPTNLSMETAGVVTWNDPTPQGGFDLAGVPTAGTVLGSTNAISNPKNEIKFVVEKSTDGVIWAVAGEALANATSWTDAAYVDGNQYRVIANNCATHVFATNTCTGNSAPSSVLAVSSSVAAPTALPQVIALNGLTANLNWTDNATNETAYRIEVAMVSANGAVGTYTQLANFARSGVQTTGTGEAMVYAATTVLGKHYRYRVSALNGTLSSLAIMFDVDLTAPQQPIAPTVSEVFLQLDATNSKINVSWLDNAADESGYVIEQSMDRGAWTPFLLLNAVIPGTNTRAQVMADVISGHTYSYRIASYKSNLWQRTNSAWLVTGELGVGLPAAPVLPTTVIAANGLSATLSWTDKSNNEDSFLVQVSTDNGLTYTTATNGTIVRTGAAQSYAKDVVVSYNAVTLPGVSYKYRVKAVNWLGSSSTISFNVVTAPSTPTTLLTVLNYQAATGLRTNVSWLDNSNNETSYVVESSTDSGLTFAQAAVLDRAGALGTTTGTRASIWVPVLAGQRYTFRVKAVRTNLGVTSNSTYLTSAVNVVDATLPAAPTGLPTVVAATGLSATLSWTDNANNETNYLVETSTNNGVTYGSPTTVTRTGAVVAATGGVVTPPNKVTAPGTKYTYRITARNLAGSSAPITVVADLSPPATPLAPTAVISVLDNTGTLATVSWTDNSNNETGYRVEVAVALGASSATPFGAYVAQPILDRTANGTSTGTRVSLPVTVAPNNRYKFRISAVNTRYGLSKYSNLLTSGVLDTRIPNAPTGLSATPSVVVGVPEVALAWTDNSAIETSYTVQRAVITNGVAGVYSSLPAIARVGVETTGFGAVAFTDTTVALGTSYSYKVFASNANGDSGMSNLVTADMTLPVAPTIQSVTPESTGIAVRWLDNSANETGFLVEISADAGVTWNPVETTASGVLISHAPLSQPGSYTFRVSAINQWGVPATSTSLPITLSQPIAPTLQQATLDATGVNLTWNQVANATAYQVEVSSNGVNGPWTTEATTTLMTQHLPIVTAGIYNYRVTALTAVAAIKSSASVEIVQVDLSTPATPSLSQVTDATGTGVDLSWLAVPGATGYQVEYSTTGAAPWTLVETTASNVLTSHAPVTTPGIYSYQVTALTPVTGINSLPSNLVTVNLTTPATPTQFVARLVGTGVTAAVDLTWTDNATNESGYAIEVDYSTGAWVRKTTIPAGTGAMTWQDPDTTAGIRTYRVVALTTVDAIASLPSATDSVDYNLTAPLELFSTTVQSIALQSVVLTWSDQPGNNAGGYRIYRSDAPATVLAEVPVHVMTYTDTTAVTGISYTYRVTAVNPWGETAGVTAVADLSAPVAPSGLSAQIISDGAGAKSTYTLTWQDNSNNEAYFIIEFSADGGNTWGVGNVPPNRTNHGLNATATTGTATETGLPYGTVLPGVTNLSIRVIARNSVGVYSAPTAVVPLLP